MSDEVKFKITINHEETTTTLVVSYSVDTTFEEILEEVFDNAKIAETKRDGLEAKIDGTRIEREYYEKSLRDLGIESNDHIVIQKIEHDDGARIEQGKVFILNSTIDNWKIKSYPNNDRLAAEAGRTVQVEGPSFEVPLVGQVNAGGFNYVKESVPIQLGDVPDNDNSITIKRHQIRSMTYSNLMKNQKPLPVRIHFYNETTKFEETKMVENREAVILTDEGLIEGKTSKNFFTRRTKPTWMPKYPPSHDKNLSYDPHKDLASGTK